MKWTQKQPKMGDPIRVKASFYYHYGIFADAEHVYAFGLPDNTGVETADIAVVCTDVADFLNGGMLERGELGLGEKLNRKSAKNTIAYAAEHVGETGYHILDNNCEDFMNRCLYGEKLADRQKLQARSEAKRVTPSNHLEALAAETSQEDANRYVPEDERFDS